MLSAIAFILFACTVNSRVTVGKLSLRKIIALIGAGMSVALAVLLALPVLVSSFVPDDLSKLPDNVLAKLDSAAKQDPKNVVIVTGSSLAQLGVDPVALEGHLKQSGCDCAVVSVARGGASYFERADIINEAVDRVLDGSRKAKIVVLHEVFMNYDDNPIDIYSSKAWSDRNLAFLDIRTALRVIHFSFDIRVLKRGLSEEISSYPELLEQGIANLFRFGQMEHWFLPRRDTTRIGYEPWGIGIPKQDPVSAARVKNISDFLRTHELSPNSGMPDIAADAEGMVRMVFGGISKNKRVELLGFQPVNLNAESIVYGETFCKATKMMRCLQTGKDYPKMLDQLQDQTFWYDKNHLTLEGAEIYTRELADELMNSKALVQ